MVISKRYLSRSHLLLAMISLGAIIETSGAYATSGIEDSGDYYAANHLSTEDQQLLQDATYIKQALAYKNYSAITPFIHPTRGVRFSMYAHVDPKTDKVFSRAQFTQYLKASRIKFTWGQQDGTGNLYITPLPKYLDNWVQANQYKSIGPTFNQFQVFGNSSNNLKKTYPNANFVEFYNHGSAEYDGMDWKTLRLVFEEYKGKRYLVAIINDQWTI